VVSNADGAESCVLCHQRLSPEAAERLKQFESFVSGKLTSLPSILDDASTDPQYQIAEFEQQSDPYTITSSVSASI
jgi:hypothetical protein